MKAKNLRGRAFTDQVRVRKLPGVRLNVRHVYWAVTPTADDDRTQSVELDGWSGQEPHSQPTPPPLYTSRPFSSSELARSNVRIRRGPRTRDALSDPRALANPLVAGEFGLRFYEDRHTLAELAGAVMDQMELRIASRNAVRSLLKLNRHAPEQDAEGELDTKGMTTICAWTKSVLVDGEWMTFERFLETQFGLKVTHGIRPDEADRIIE